MSAPLQITIRGGSGSYVPSPSEMTRALALPSIASRFHGVLQYMRADEPGTPPTWRTMGPNHGECSLIHLLEAVRFLLGDLRVTQLRIIKVSDVAPQAP